jgi:dUTP pyrophosphatase
MNSAIYTASTSTNSTYTQKLQCQLQPGAKLPQRAHPDDAGADLAAWLPEGVAQIEIYPGEQKMVDTGVALKIPPGYAGFVYNRSSQGKQGITIPHSVGIIDASYRGTVKVILKNLGEDPYVIKTGDRIAQLVIQRVELVGFEDWWNDSNRGTGGFGSTGA